MIINSVFCETKNGVNQLDYMLKANDIKSASMHGDKNQNQRQVYYKLKQECSR